MTINRLYMRQERLVRDLRRFADAHPRLLTALITYHTLLMLLIWLKS